MEIVAPKCSPSVPTRPPATPPPHPTNHQPPTTTTNHHQHPLPTRQSHVGLKIATASMDGSVRIYEAIDVMNLRDWALQGGFEAASENATCLAWNPSKFDAPMLVVGGRDVDQTAHVKVWHYPSAQRKVRAAAGRGGCRRFRMG